VRAQKESAVVVLGSATPSLESFHNAKGGKYQYLHLPERVANRKAASIGKRTARRQPRGL